MRFWLLGSPVSNSDRLASMIRDVNPEWIAEVVPDPDLLLRQPGDIVATADAGILDRWGQWVNLSRALVQDGVLDAFVVDLA